MANRRRRKLESYKSYRESLLRERKLEKQIARGVLVFISSVLKMKKGKGLTYRKAVVE